MAFEAAGTPSLAGPWNDDFASIEGVYLQNGGEYLVGLSEERIVAMGALRKVTADTAEVKRMRVHPDYWRRGYGQAIFDRLQARAIELGYKKLVLDTLEPQEAAQQLYIKNGFRKFGRKRVGPFECLLFKKNLGQQLEKADSSLRSE
ncbi:MAG: GNAT family N-acetyltransferase [Acidobacteria bacterium]|nr:GNAT family N-acetyltransferase [Acidobacteriota bacterium]